MLKKPQLLSTNIMVLFLGGNTLQFLKNCFLVTDSVRDFMTLVKLSLYLGFYTAICFVRILSVCLETNVSFLLRECFRIYCWVAVKSKHVMHIHAADDVEASIWFSVHLGSSLWRQLQGHVARPPICTGQIEKSCNQAVARTYWGTDSGELHGGSPSKCILEDGWRIKPVWFMNTLLELSVWNAKLEYLHYEPRMPPPVKITPIVLALIVYSF